jgi:AcrR family transcriptional regulator
MPTIPTTPKGLRTRDKILEASRKVFAKDGFVEARMVDIASQAGLSTGGLYRYFEDKTDVFAALIADLHEELYQASGHTEHSLATEPLTALTEANSGYIRHYHENRDVMRSFIEAAAVDQRFREIWWTMRQRHVERFDAAVRAAGVREKSSAPLTVTVEAMACMVEQCCYVWFAQEKLNQRSVSVDEAIATVSEAWYRALFSEG